MLLAALAAIGAAAAGAGVGREVLSALRVALPFALLVTLINPLVYQEGDTLLIRGGEILGRASTSRSRPRWPVLSPASAWW